MTMTLPPELEGRIQEKIATGLYLDVNDVWAEALRLLDAEDNQRLTELRAAIDHAREQGSRGEDRTWTEHSKPCLLADSERAARNLS